MKTTLDPSFRARVDLFDLLRRLAISDDSSRQAAGKMLARSVPGFARQNYSAISLLADVIAHVQSVTPRPEQVQALARDFLRASVVLRESLPPPPRDDNAAMAMIDDFLLRSVQDANAAATEVLLHSLKLPRSLPFVDLIADHLRTRFSLHAPCVILACQHLLGSIIPQFGQLHAFGIPYEDMFLLGKPYSANRAVVLALRSLGLNVSESSLEFPPEAAKNASGYATFMKHAAVSMAREGLQRAAELGAGTTVLVIDDGGLLIENVLRLTADAPPGVRIAGVEQTTGGLRKLQRQRTRLRWPVVNVAESSAKQNLESPFIAQSIVDELLGRLRRLRGVENLTNLAVTVVGYGAVGSWVCLILKDAHARVTVYDSDTKKLALARAAHLWTAESLRDALIGASAVVGCTGDPWLEWERSRAYVGAETVMASASSADIEFRGLRGRGRGVFRWPWSAQFEKDSDFQRAHNDYRVAGDLGSVWLTNAGFPVNFTGGVDPIDPDIIQLTRALMLAGSLQAIHAPARKKLIPLDARINGVITREAVDTILQSHLGRVVMPR